MSGPDRLIGLQVSRRSLVAFVIASPVVFSVERIAAQVATPEASPSAVAWSDEDLAQAGLTGPMSYRSPMYGYTVEWTEAWQLEPGPVPPVRSNPEWGATGRDDLFLVLGEPTVDARLAFSSRAADGLTVGDMMDTPLPANGGVRLLIRERMTQVTWVDLAFAEGTATPERVEVNQVVALDDGALLFIWMHAVPDSIEVAFTTARDILLDGETVFGTVEWQDLAEGLARWP